MNKCYFCNNELSRHSDIWSSCYKHHDFLPLQGGEIYHFQNGVVDYFINYQCKDYNFAIENNTLTIKYGAAELVELNTNIVKDFSLEKSIDLLKKVLNNKAFI